MSRDDSYLIDIVNAANHVRDYVAGFDREALKTDSKTIAAVLYQFLVMGKAVKRLSMEFSRGAS